MRWLKQTNYIWVKISFTIIGWSLIKSWCLAFDRWYDMSEVKMWCCPLLCVDTGYMGINLIMDWIETKRYHTNLKTVFLCNQHGKFTRDDHDLKERGVVVIHCVLLQRKCKWTVKKYYQKQNITSQILTPYFCSNNTVHSSVKLFMTKTRVLQQTKYVKPWLHWVIKVARM